MHTIFVINPGSTSVKVALFCDVTEIFSESLAYSGGGTGEIMASITSCLAGKGVLMEEISAIASRGGILPPVRSGAYRVNDSMVERLRDRPLVSHASNLGAQVALELERKFGIPSYIYDAVSVDEMEGIARFSGMPELPRRSNFHALNTRAVSRETAAEMGRTYEECNFVVAHLGGGISISAHRRGRVVDVLADDEGPFSPERAGKVPCLPLLELCYSGKYDKKTASQKLRGQAGLKGYLGTADAMEIERRIEGGDGFAAEVYRAMAYQIAKGLAEMAAALEGDVDRVILTGGLARSKKLTDEIVRYAGFIAPVSIVPGEFEMKALAAGILRVLNGEETAREYAE